jgi:hypothetical protein
MPLVGNRLHDSVGTNHTVEKVGQTFPLDTVTRLHNIRLSIQYVHHIPLFHSQCRLVCAGWLDRLRLREAPAMGSHITEMALQDPSQLPGTTHITNLIPTAQFPYSTVHLQQIIHSKERMLVRDGIAFNSSTTRRVEGASAVFLLPVHEYTAPKHIPCIQSI